MILISIGWWHHLQNTRRSLHVIPAKAGIQSRNLQECGGYELDSRFRGNDVGLVREAGSKAATTFQSLWVDFVLWLRL